MTHSQPVSMIQPRQMLMPTDMLVYSTVRIECQLVNGGVSTGTGFYFNFAVQGDKCVPAIVTNKHVVRGASMSCRVCMHATGPDGRPDLSTSFFVDIPYFGSWIAHPDSTVDLCILPVAPVLQQLKSAGQTPGIIPLEMSLVPSDQEFADLTPFEEVLMVGYPSGIWDSRHNMPILRRGVTATHAGLDYEGRQEFLTDIACFCGSSGSPVLLYSTGPYRIRENGNAGVVMMSSQPRMRLLGVVFATMIQEFTGELRVAPIPTVQQVVPVSQIPINLGCVIRATRLREFDQMCRGLAT